MARVQLALNVQNVDLAVEFYSKLFGTEPSKRRPGYANFAIEEPPLKLVLIENPNASSALNHLGVEVPTATDVMHAKRRLEDAGLPTSHEASVACCYALQDKIWVGVPGSEPWEIYTVLADVDSTAAPRGDEACEAVCCATAASDTSPASACC